MIYWAGPYEFKFPLTYRNDPPVIQQRYDMLIGSLIKIATLSGTGGQYSGQFQMLGGNNVRANNLPLKEAQAAFEKGLKDWMANAGMSFDEELLRLVK